MRDIAADRRCPACGRGYALVRIKAGGLVIGKACRWCDFEKSIDV
jgi:uncharacterized protein (DUF983 family)